MHPVLYLVIPCYNEETVLKETSKQLYRKIMNMIQNEIISKHSCIVFVDDGSKDATWKIIQELHHQNNIFAGLHLSCNKGHQNAVLAGLIWAKDHADITISLDADLQDDVEVLDEFVMKYLVGNEIVYGVRESRQSDSWFKRNTALAFYKFQKIMGVQAVYNHADYRLMSKKAIEALTKFKEVNLFLRGMVPLLGYQSCTVSYERNKRFAGESKYPLRKMFSFAWDGITSFSTKPIHMITAIGVWIFIISLTIIFYCLIRKFMGYTVAGWTFIACSIWLLGGLQLLGIGMVGEYIGKVYTETKQRPRYIIEEELYEKTI